VNQSEAPQLANGLGVRIYRGDRPQSNGIRRRERKSRKVRDRRQGRAIDWRLDRQMDDQTRERGESLSLIIVVVGKELGDGEVGIEAESCLVSKSVAQRRRLVCVQSCGSLRFVCGRGSSAASTEVGSSCTGTAWLDLAADAGEWRIIVDGVPGALDLLGLGANLDFLDNRSLEEEMDNGGGGKAKVEGRDQRRCGVARNVFRLFLSNFPD